MMASGEFMIIWFGTLLLDGWPTHFITRLYLRTQNQESRQLSQIALHNSQLLFSLMIEKLQLQQKEDQINQEIHLSSSMILTKEDYYKNSHSIKEVFRPWLFQMIQSILFRLEYKVKTHQQYGIYLKVQLLKVH